MLLLYHEAAAEWYNWPLGRERAKPADRPAVKLSIIAALRLLYHSSARMRNEIFMNFHFPARTATCAAASDSSALSVTLCLFATRSLFPAPPEMPPGFGRPVFRPARLTVPRLTTAPRFCVVTLRALRDGQLLTPPGKTPCACGATAFSSAGFAVPLLPGAPRFSLSRCGSGAPP